MHIALAYPEANWREVANNFFCLCVRQFFKRIFLKNTFLPPKLLSYLCPTLKILCQLFCGDSRFETVTLQNTFSP